MTELDLIYVRGKAYLAAHEGSKAAGEFQKIIDHRVLALNPIGALAQHGLARAYGLQSDTSKAKAAYQDFLALWKGADQDIPVLKEAKAEYAGVAVAAELRPRVLLGCLRSRLLAFTRSSREVTDSHALD